MEIRNISKEKSEEKLIRRIYRMYHYCLFSCMLQSAVEKNSLAADDVLVSYWLNECAFSAVQLKRKNKNILVVSRGHGFDVFPERGYMPYRKTILSGLDLICLINRKGKECFQQLYSDWLDMSKVKVTHLGVNLPNTTLLDKVNNSVFHIVTCSSVIPLKRLDLMVKALSGIDSGSGKILWTHIGNGVLFDQIQNDAKEFLTQDNVLFEFLGAISLSDVLKYYQTNYIDLFVNCSDTEGIPVSVMEAMSYGIPAIARDVGGNSELVDNECGILLSSDNPVELRRGIERIMHLSKSDYRLLRDRAKEKIQKEFCSDKNYERFYNLIEHKWVSET